jgi:hypothetical protein
LQQIPRHLLIDTHVDFVIYRVVNKTRVKNKKESPCSARV